MKNLEGRKVPQVTFRTRRGSDWENRTSNEPRDFDSLF